MMIQVVQISSQNLLSGCSHLLKMRNKILSLQCFKRDDVKIKDFVVDGIGIMDLHYVEMLNVSLENGFQLFAVRHPGATITVSVDNVDHRRLHAAAAGRGWRGLAGHGQRLGLDPAEHIEPHERGHRHERHPQPGGHEQKVDRLKL